ncbi:ENTH domain-containing protein C794.11c-like [Durio zibethinus]|uniref:ENTH domain-containing protein C794.11c-like n=1 Tax=Durio zibethinus TaxID=66656 RepID=A0A6P5ZUW5_DURZI|nr:ENTH domain-containing protein C794.11c-like [Durio zibethinus]
MSTLSKNPSSSSISMTSPFFHEFKKQASFFLREKIKTARLALTDVTPAQLLTEEATNGNTRAPDTRTLGSISKAAFELDDYWRIVEILHKKLAKFERKNWRISYNSLIVLEHLLTHGPESTAEEFQGDKEAIVKMQGFQYIDEKGFNWGLAVRKKSERISKLLEKGPVLKEERDRARKLTRGILGFGSFCQRSSSTQGVLQESSHVTFGRSNSDFIDYENQLPTTNEGSSIHEVEKSQHSNENAHFEAGKKQETFRSWSSFSEGQMFEKPEVQTSFKENMAPIKEEFHNWSATGESNPLLGNENSELRTEILMEDDHPFNSTENQTTSSMLLARNGILQGC